MANKDEVFTIYDISVIKNLNDVRSAMQFLHVLTEICDAYGAINKPKTALAKAFNVTPHTISNWLRKLAKNGALKYKYSGTARLNPFFYFHGTQADFDIAEREYKAFKSDMATA